MRVSRADWAALVPWNGVQDKPGWAQGDVLTIDDIQGLRDALIALGGAGAGSGGGSTIVFGSAAFVDSSYFQTAWTERTQQMGLEPILIGQRDYDIAFTTTMTAVPKVFTQLVITDGSGEMFYDAIQNDMLTDAGFRVRLSSAPLASGGFIQWKAQVENQPS